MKLNNKKIIYVGLAFLIISMFGTLYDNVINKMAQNTFGLGQFWSGVILIIDNILALFLIPFFGSLSDKTKTKYGRRTPYIVLGVVISAMLIPGIAVFDNLQQNKLVEGNIPRVEDITELENKTATFNGQTYDNYAQAFRAQQAIVFNAVKDNLFYFIGWLIVILLVLTVMAAYRSPAVALMPDVTVKPLRSKANAIINLMGAVGAIIFLLLAKFLSKDYNSYIPLFVAISILMIILLLIWIRKVKEPKLVDELNKDVIKYGLEEKEEIVSTTEKMSPAVKRSFILILTSIILWFMAYNAATSKFSTYTQQVLQMGYSLPLMVAQASAIITFIPIGILSSKFGRKKMILVGILILTLAFVLGIIATPKTLGLVASKLDVILIYLTMSVAGIGWATINVNSYPMIVEMSKGANVGKYTGYYYTASMFAQILTPIISGALMEYIDPRVLFPYSVIFCILAFLTMLFVKHGDAKPILTK